MNTKPKYPTTDLQIPGGRFVLGSLTELQTKDNNGRDRKNPTMFIAVAVDKRAPGVDQAIGQIIGYTQQTYQMVPGVQQVISRIMQPNFLQKGFAWKIKDGDHDPKWSQREGCKGCWIFIFNTSFCPVRCCDNNLQQIDPKTINLGDYVDVFASVAINGEVGDTAGIYLNPNGVRMLGYGQRIIPAGQSFDQMFANAPAALPPGASPTPVGAPAYQQPPAPAYQQPPAPAYQQPPAPAYQQPPAPGPAYQQPPAPAYQQPPAPAYQQPPAPAYQQPPAPGPAYPTPAGAPGVPAGAAPAQAPQGAGYTSPGGYPATAYPTDPHFTRR